MMQCDFCSSPDVKWAYKAEPFAGMVLGVDRDGDIMSRHFSSDDGWAACDACHQLIEAGDRDGLIDRCLYQSHNPDVAAMMHELPTKHSQIRQMLETFHAAFWDTKYAVEPFAS